LRAALTLTLAYTRRRRREFPKLDYITECRVVGTPRYSLKAARAAAQAAAEASAALAARSGRIWLFVAGFFVVSVLVLIGFKQAGKADRLVQ
jgi:hypothetical protein